MGAMSAPTPTVVVGFDLDLTLVDSRERIMTSYLRALHDVGDPVTREDLEPHLGIPLTHTIAAVAPAVDADALVLLYRHYYDQASAPSTDPMPGALAAVRALRAVGGRTVVVSAKFTPAAHERPRRGRPGRPGRRPPRRAVRGREGDGAHRRGRHRLRR